MCVVAFAAGTSADYPLVFAANRDELHTRPTAMADWWPDAEIFGGRDLAAGGSWLAVNRAGQLAAVTNLPQANARKLPRSRGELVRDFLTRENSASEFVQVLAARANEYGPFNFLGYDGRIFHYVGTQTDAHQLAPGEYALSNAPWGTDWPKVRIARQGLRAALRTPDPVAALHELLAPKARTGDDPLDRRTALFIDDPVHGTRSSTVILRSADGQLRFSEYAFAADGRKTNAIAHTFMVGRQPSERVATR